MRSVCINRAGRTRVARRTCEFYSIIFGQTGTARVIVRGGDGVDLFDLPSSKDGSFVMGANAPDGLEIEMYGYPVPNITINWREPDRKIV